MSVWMKYAFCIIQLQCAKIYGLVFTANPQNDKYAQWLVAFLFVDSKLR